VATVGRSLTDEYTRRPGVDNRFMSLITGSPSKYLSLDLELGPPPGISTRA